MRCWHWTAFLFVLFCSAASSAKDDAGAPERVSGTCVERIPEGKERPAIKETFPAKGLTGYALGLEVVVEHGKGETVLPNGFRVQLDSDAAKALKSAGFALPDPDGGAGPSIQQTPDGERIKSTVKISVVALPEKPGRSELTLPPLPIAISRASGEVLTLCTAPHEITVEDPISNTPDPAPHENPAPRPQRELWNTAKQVAIASLIALIVGALVAWLIGRWRRRPKAVPPPPPPRPPWDVALEELVDLKHAELVKSERFVEHFDRVSHIVRRYCGERYGFDGLESTTREMIGILRRVIPPIPVLEPIETFLREADLVKFAKLTPSAEECEHALASAEDIVKRSIPFRPPVPTPAHLEPEKEGDPSPPPADPGEAK
jgi:hypothetical protein